MSDPISNFLTVIRNAYRANKETCDTRYSKIHLSIAEILKEEGYLRNVEKIDEDGKQYIRLSLKYVDETPAVTGIKRVSTPGRRLYFQSRDIPRTLGGLGVGILTTSRGILKDRDARRQNVGGEMICAIW
ncbi:30S ribosomal protein S8 [Puniceicoccales bacterium CK1056]|uniref:Small ribosomal subunit protein uS8 n=1 Tax=Oceanipulchritudo coccoides TaxID=2706888 RepID=A0A6B2M3J4_9BACT|nr:30S ribosomal protein S8 [Oceanipulchritudo coccoides]NDV62657.1 30S ribosomal protein S8 [Oceanipulchritudo coccoides]